jgi:PAS domain S-box
MEDAAVDDSVFRLLFFYNPIPMWLYDPQTLKFLEVNNAAIAHYGYSRDEFRAMTLEDIRPVEALPKLYRALESAPERSEPGGHRAMGVWRHRKKDGTLIDVEIIVTSIPAGMWGRSDDLRGDTDPRSLRVAFITDVTERRRTEDTLRLRESALEAATNGILVADARRAALPIVYVNPAFERITGYSYAEVVGRDCSFLESGGQHQPMLAALQQALLEGGPLVVTLRNRRKNGDVFFHELHIAPIRDNEGTITHLVGVQNDVTERRRAEEESRRREEELRTLADNVPDLIARFDLNLRHVYINRAAENALGLLSAEVVGKTNAELGMPPEIAALWEESMRTALQTGEVQDVLFTQPSPQGLRTYEGRIALERGRDGRVDGLLCLTRDITERRWSELERRSIMRSARCLLWSAIVTELYSDFLEWEYMHYDEEAAQRFLPLEREPGEPYPHAAYRHRHPQDRLLADHYGSAQIRAGQDYSQEFRCRGADGRWHWHREELHVETLEAGKRWRVVGVTTDITERRETEERLRLLNADLEESAQRQRRFVRDVLLIATEGKLHLCDSAQDLPPVPEGAVPATPAGVLLEPPRTANPPQHLISLSSATLVELRRAVRAATEHAKLPFERAGDLLIGAGEAAMNAVVHGGGGIGAVHADAARGVVQVRIQDTGSGIMEDLLHQATLKRGWSSLGTQGQGFWMMLQSCDRVYLLTGPTGTTVVLEQEREKEEL